jgi:peptidoglycan/LPS O-acetylase OafA/YrhL
MKFGELLVDRKNNLNLLRLLAATAVAFSHSYYFAGQLQDEPLLKLTGNITLGYFSVFIFFIISGFLVAQSFNLSQSIFGFWTGRALRLYPALIVVLIFCAYVLGPIFTTHSVGDYIFRDEVRQYVEDNLIFKEHTTLPGVFVGAVNGSLWSLRYEVYAYLLLFCFGIFGLISSRAAMNAAAIFFLFLYAKEPLGLVILPDSWNNVISVPLAGFFWGTLVYVNRNHIDCKISYAIVGLVLYISLRQHLWSHIVFVLTLGYGVLTLGFHRHLQLNILLPNDYSYGIYLYAFPIQQAIINVKQIDSALTLFAITMLLTLPLAMLSWHLVEKPALRLKKYFKQGSRNELEN